MISVLILTSNDEAILASCLKSVAWSDDIVIFDAFSTDRTVEIATQAGARVIQRAFDNNHDHRAAALAVHFKNDWVFYLNPDEIALPRLREEMAQLVMNPKRTEVGYRARFRLMFLGKWIKHSSLHPIWVLRLFRKDQIRCQSADYVVDGPTGLLTNYLERYSFAKGVRYWLADHNRQSTAEAKRFAQLMSTGRINWRRLLSTSSVVRRDAIKELSFRVPFRSFWIYMYLMVLRRGVLDGPPGWIYCRLRAHYNFIVQAKLEEL
ncbi:MAG TPA: glycosyltransferase family 2 protein, partial [Tepidisphaeraceae bacterium]